MYDSRQPPLDRHIRRSGDDYTQAALRLLPQGQAWPRAPDSTLARTIAGLFRYYGYVDGRAADLLERESDPRTTTDVTLSDGTRDGLLSDWEKAWGLPDPCFPKATSIAERQKMLVLFMTWLGGQSRQYFIELMKWLGFTVTIGEFAPFMAGVSRAGDTSDGQGGHMRWYIGPPEMRFYWTAHSGQVSYTWFRASSGQAGVDPHLRIGVPEDIECLLRRWKPAHTELVFDFAAMGEVGPMEGTP